MNTQGSRIFGNARADILDDVIEKNNGILPVYIEEGKHHWRHGTAMPEDRLQNAQLVYRHVIEAFEELRMRGLTTLEVK